MKFQPYFEVCFSNEMGSFSIPSPVRESHDVIDAPRGGRDQIGGRKRGPVSLTSSGCKEVILQPAKLSKIIMKPVRSNTTRTRIDRMDISLSLSAAMRGGRRRSMIDFVGRPRSLSLSLSLWRKGGCIYERCGREGEKGLLP